MGSKGRRKHQPVAIDTFNIVGDRRIDFQKEDDRQAAIQITRSDELVMPVQVELDKPTSGFHATSHTVGQPMGAFLPDISVGRKSGLSQGVGSNKKQHQHRGSNSFSGVVTNTGEDRGMISPEGQHNPVLSENGDDIRSYGRPQKSAQMEHYHVKSSIDDNYPGSNAMSPPLLQQPMDDKRGRTTANMAAVTPS